MRRTRRRTALGPALVVASCAAVQLSAAVAAPLVEELGSAAVAGWRQATGAVVLLLVVRPGVRGRKVRDWAWIAVLGISMASMNVAFYSAVALLPLGVAATLLYLGPFAVACAGFRRGPSLLLPTIALTGVVLVSRPGAVDGAGGLAVGLAAAAALALYTLSSRAVGQRGGVDLLTLSVVASAVLLTPFSVASAPSLDGPSVVILVVTGAVGVAGAFWLDFRALQLIGSRAVSVLFALDPAIGAVAGAALLGQHADLLTAVGVAAVVASGAVAAAVGGDRSSDHPGRRTSLGPGHQAPGP